MTLKEQLDDLGKARMKFRKELLKAMYELYEKLGIIKLLGTIDKFCRKFVKHKDS